MTPLLPDTIVPALSVDFVGGGRWNLANQHPASFSLIVFYRGYHCPVCKTYLQQLNAMVDDFDEVGTTVVAISMNNDELATRTKKEWELSDLTIGFGLPEADARSWGLYISKSIRDGEIPLFCEPGLFVVRPDGRLFMVSVSNMP